VAIANDLIPARIIESARTLILKHGADFTVALLCTDLECTRQAIRRHFPTKADVISAVFQGDSSAVKAEVAVSKPSPSFEDKRSTETEWLERRFRVFERAISILESDIASLRQDNSKFLARLEAKLSAGGKTAQWSKGKTASPNKNPDGHTESLGGAPAAANIRKFDTTDANDESFPSDGPAAPISSRSLEKPPIVESTEFGPAPIVVLKSGNSPESEMHFTVRSEDVDTKKDGWKELSIFGVNTFIASLALLSLALLLVTSARASHVPGVKVTDRGILASTANLKNGAPIADVAPEKGVVAKTISAVTGTSPPISWAQKSSNLRSPSAESALLNQARSGDVKAQLRLALAYAKGDGVAASPMLAAFWSETAAQQGDADAQYLVGTLAWDGVKPDPAQAVQQFSAAAAGGNLKAMHNLAIALLSGQGVSKDGSLAARWFTRAANLGYRDSAFDLGVLYEGGQGVPQNSRIALSWYDKAAAMGDQQATQRATLLRSNGLSSLNGDLGVMVIQ
jgi:hypothetical protein